MKDDLLGTLTENVQIKGALNGSVEYRGTAIALHIDPDGGSLDKCLELARLVVANLREIEETAKNAAAIKLLETYNDNWREYSEADTAGSFVDVSNPEISSDEFKSRIALSSLSVTGDELASIGFGDGGLFAGHSIFVTSFNGLAFSDVHVEVFG